MEYFISVVLIFTILESLAMLWMLVYGDIPRTRGGMAWNVIINTVVLGWGFYVLWNAT